MLVIDENKLRLLRMKEKLLEVSLNNRDEILSQYKEIVTDIDKDMYDRLINIIKNANYHNQPLEEQLEFLTNLENEYNSFNEFQCRYRNIYEQYASDKLELSPIEDIYIGKIKERVDAINGYLINNQNLVRYHNSLENLNVQLIDSEKKKSAIEIRFGLLEDELKENVFKAEGRIDNHGNLEYASILKEFEKYDLSLGILLDDNNLLSQALDDAKNTLSSEEDKMEAAKVCFNNMPTIETKKLYNVSYFDVLNANYKLVILSFADLIAKKCNSYEEIKEKRIKLKSLIKERAKLLNDLGIKYAVDPFDRIKLDEQFEIIELLGKNLQNVLFIKEKIRDTFKLVDEINNKNNELYLTISQQTELFNNRFSVIDVIGDVGPSVEHSQVDEKKVINVRDISHKLNLGLIREKTNGVINRVYELFSNVPVTIKSEEVIPELVIEKDSIFNDGVAAQEIFEDNSFKDNDLFSDVSAPARSENTLSSQGDIFTDELDTQQIFSDNNTKSAVDNELFSEVEPFQETVLFTNRYDDVFTASQKDEEMPELFFESEQKVFDDDKDEDAGSELSLDEQIKALKLVA